MNGLKLGKLPAREDKRTFQMRMVLPAKLPPIPDSFNVDNSLPCPMTIAMLMQNTVHAAEGAAR